MKQPIAKVTINDIHRLIRRDFPGNEAKVLKLLNKYQGEGYRVWAAILKLANADFSTINNHVKIAINDFRDVISLAEYPEYSARIGFDSDKFNRREIAEIINRDNSQYQNWFKR